MNIRERTEQLESQILSSYAKLSRDSAGRCIEESPCKFRTCFQRDRDRILHSKSFRRLKRKTQVFLSPEGDHYRTRLTHTLEVSQIARSIARCLSLNEDLTEAIALAHDLGHTPFGHAGEQALNSLMPGGFCHFKQGVRVVQKIEKDGQGLNLTKEVIDGIACHTRGQEASTLEGRIVKLADRIAFVNHDIDDAIRAGIITMDDVPSEAIKLLGEKQSVRINTLIESVVNNSFDGHILMDENVQLVFDVLYQFMYDVIYTSSQAKEEEAKVPQFIEQLYKYYLINPEEIPAEILKVSLRDEDSISRAVCDYIASMTDDYAINQFNNIFIPKSWKSKI